MARRPNKVSQFAQVLRRATLIVFLAVGLAGCEEWFPHWRAFEVMVDLTVEGERMQITRKIMCEGKVSREFIRAFVRYRTTTHAFGERLRSGGAVMVVTPSFCADPLIRAHAIGTQLPVRETYIPFIGWADNAERPNVIEAYVSPGYFERGTGRVQYHGMTARVIDTVEAKAGPVDQFDWFGRASGEDARFSYNVVVIPESVWRTIEGVAVELDQISYFERLPSEMRSKLGLASYISWAAAELFSGQGVKVRLAKERLETLNTFHPLFRSNGEFKIRPDQQGYLVFYRSSVLRDADGAISTITFDIGGSRTEVPTNPLSSSIYYDPDSRTIYRVQVAQLRFPPDR